MPPSPASPPNPRQLVAAAAHRLLADLIAAGLDHGEVLSEPAIGSRCQVWVTVVPQHPTSRPDAGVGQAPPPSGREVAANPDGCPAADYSERELAVLEVLGRLPAGACHSGPRLAELTGYPYQATLKTCLSSLRRRGVIDHRTGQGYFLVRT